MSGEEVEIHYWAGLKAGSHAEDEAEIFPAEDAHRLAEMLDDWAHSIKGSEGWDTTKDSVDNKDQWQTMIYNHGRDEVDEGRTGYDSYPMPASGLPAYENPDRASKKWASLGPLAAALHQDVFLPRMRSVGREDVPMYALFMRKYSPQSRTTIRAHRDNTVMTFNMALSDRELCEGGSLFICNKFPNSWGNLLSTTSHLGGEGEFEASWFELQYPESHYMTGNGSCKPAQPPMGSMVAHFGHRFHGVQKITSGTRFSLIAFYGDTAGSAKDYDIAQRDIHKYADTAVENLAEEEIDRWLDGLDNITSEFGILEGHKFVFQTSVFASLELTLALTHYMGNAGHVKKIFRVMEAFSSGNWKAEDMKAEDIRRELAERNVVHLVQGALKAHAQDEEIPQLACSILQLFECGSQTCAESEQSCAGFVQQGDVNGDGSDGEDEEEQDDEDEDDLEELEREAELKAKTPKKMRAELTSELFDLSEECSKLTKDILFGENAHLAPRLPRKCMAMFKWMDLRKPRFPDFRPNVTANQAEIDALLSNSTTTLAAEAEASAATQEL